MKKYSGARPVGAHDPALLNYHGVSLNSNLALSLRGADLIIIVADHTEYSDLNVEEVGNAIVYDGRGIIDTSRPFGPNLVSMGVGKNIIVSIENPEAEY